MDENAERYKSWRYSLTSDIIKNHNIIKSKNFHEQLTDPDVKRYKEMRKL